MNTLYLETEITIPRTCSSFYFKDSTPAYDSITEPNGYDPSGTNCVDPNDINSNLLTVSITNMATPTVTKVITIPSSAFDINRIPGLVEYEILPSAINPLSTTIDDGIYKFFYEITLNSGVKYNRTCYVLKDCTICCALDQKLKDLKNCGTCDKQNERSINMLYEAYMLKQKAHHLLACHDYAGAQEVIDYLTRLLDVTYCDGCSNS